MIDSALDLEKPQIVYFELNNWICGRDYPDAEPILTWLKDYNNIPFMDQKGVEENNLCVVFSLIDMSYNFCIAAPLSWVEKECPELLTKYKKFIYAILPEDEENIPEGRSPFVQYNVGIYEWDD